MWSERDRNRKRRNRLETLQMMGMAEGTRDISVGVHTIEQPPDWGGLPTFISSFHSSGGKEGGWCLWRISRMFLLSPEAFCNMLLHLSSFVAIREWLPCSSGQFLISVVLLLPMRKVKTSFPTDSCPFSREMGRWSHCRKLSDQLLCFVMPEQVWREWTFVPCLWSKLKPN